MAKPEEQLLDFFKPFAIKPPTEPKQTNPGDNAQELLRLFGQAKEAYQPPPSPLAPIGNLAANAGKSAVAGIGDFLQGAAGFGKFLEGATGVPGGALTRPTGQKAIGALQAVGPEPVPFEGVESLKNPQFYATSGARAVAGSLPYMLAGFGAAGSLAKGASFGNRFMQAVRAGLTSRTLESGVEAGGTYEEALQGGSTRGEAVRAGTQTFAGNMALSPLEALEFATALAPGGAGAKTLLGKIGKGAGRLAFGGAQESAEEGLQETISRMALGQPVDFDQEMQQAMVLGGLLGTGFTGAGQMSQTAPKIVRRIEEKVREKFTKEQNDIYETNKAQLIGQGVPDEAAMVQLLDMWSDVPAVQDLISKSAEEVAQEIDAGLSPKMAKTVMKRAELVGPDLMTPEGIKKSFPSMSKQQAERAFQQVVNVHDIPGPMNQTIPDAALKSNEIEDHVIGAGFQSLEQAQRALQVVEQNGDDALKEQIDQARRQSFRQPRDSTLRNRVGNLAQIRKAGMLPTATKDFLRSMEPTVIPQVEPPAPTPHRLDSTIGVLRILEEARAKQPIQEPAPAPTPAPTAQLEPVQGPRGSFRQFADAENQFRQQLQAPTFPEASAPQPAKAPLDPRSYQPETIELLRKEKENLLTELERDAPSMPKKYIKMALDDVTNKLNVIDQATQEEPVVPTMAPPEQSPIETTPTPQEASPGPTGPILEKDARVAWISATGERMAGKVLRVDGEKVVLDSDPTEKHPRGQLARISREQVFLEGNLPDVPTPRPVAQPELTRPQPTARPEPDQGAEVKKQKQAARHLKTLADQMQTQIDAKRGDRLDNTPRRAKMAKNIEGDANRLEEQQTTLRNLAEAAEIGTLPGSLSNIKARTHIETLDRELRRSVHLASQAQRDKFKYDDPATEEHLEWASMRGHVHPANLKSLLEEAKGKRGVTDARGRAEMILTANGNFSGKDDIAALEKLIKIAPENARWVKESLAEHKRLINMGITNTDELKQALRDYINFRGGLSEEQRKAQDLKNAEREFVGTKIPGFFPTPKPIVEKMVNAAYIQPGDKVLEPSAGKGDIADVVKEKAPESEVSVVEIVPSLQELLRKKGYNPTSADFLKFKEGNFNRIVMNPPFEKGQDIDHVRHAYDLLSPGGRVVAIMSEGPFFRSDKKATEFRNWLDEKEGTSEKLDAGSFKDSFRSTGVSSRMVVIDKPTEQQDQNTRDQMVITRLVDNGAREESFTVKRGDRVHVLIGKDKKPMTVKGISHAKSELRVESDNAVNKGGIWIRKNFIYQLPPEEAPVAETKKKGTKPLSQIVKAASNEPPGGFTEADRVGPTSAEDTQPKATGESRAEIEERIGKLKEALRTRKNEFGDTMTEAHMEAIPKSIEMWEARLKDAAPEPTIRERIAKVQQNIREPQSTQEPQTELEELTQLVETMEANDRDSREYYRAAIKLGTTTVPGVRLADAETAGENFFLLEKGDITQEQWDEYVADLKASNKVKTKETRTAVQKAEEDLSKEEAPKEPAAKGNREDVKTPAGTEVKVQYALVNESDLVASHDDSLKVNPDYPAALQPRDRSRGDYELQITELVNKLDPRWLGDSPRADFGAPITSKGLVVESGNGRIIAIRRAYERAHPNSKKYRDWLLENAPRFGIPKDEVQKLNRPVLVRVRTSDVDRMKFVSEANERSSRSMSATEQAKSDAARMSSALMDSFVPHEDGRLLHMGNQDFTRNFFRDVVSPNERGQYTTKDKGISQAGVTRIQNAIFSYAYGDASTLEKLAEDPDPTLKNITGAMLNASGSIASVKDGITRGIYHDLDLSADIADSANTLSRIKEQGMEIQDFLDQTSLFDSDVSDLTKELLFIYDRHKRSRKKLSDILIAYTEGVKKVGTPIQESMFGGKPPTKAEILTAAVQAVEGGKYNGGVQTALFEGGSVTSEAVDADNTQTGEEGEIFGSPQTAEKVEAEALPDPDMNPIRRKEIIDAVERKLLVPIREKRMTLKGAVGEFKVRPNIIRTRRPNDLQTIAHEIGHSLSKSLKIKPESYTAELKPMGARIYPKRPEIHLEEGVAEFFRLYFTDHKKAREAAPRFHAALEEQLSRESDVGEVVHEVQRLYQKWYGQNALDRVKGMIVDEQPKERPLLTNKEKVYTWWADDVHTIYKVMKMAYGEDVKSEWDVVEVANNPYILARLARGRGRKAEGLLVSAMTNPDHEIIGPSFKEILEPVRDAIVSKDFQAWLAARRAVNLHERGINPGMNKADAEEVAKKLDSKKFREAAEHIYAYQDNLIDHLVDAGVLGKSVADGFRKMNDFYVPFYRYFGEEASTGGLRSAGKKFGNQANPVKKITGSERDIIDPLTSIIRNTIYLIDVAARNRVALSVVDTVGKGENLGWVVERIPTPMEPRSVNLADLKKDLREAGVPDEVLNEADLERMAVTFQPVKHARFKEGKENILTVYRNGEPEFYQLHPELYRSMQFLDAPSSNWALRFLGIFSRILRTGAVLNPEFAVRNPTRDTMSATIQSKYRFLPVVDTARGIFHVLKKDDLYKKWISSGAGQSTLLELNQDYLSTNLRHLIGEKTKKEKAIDILKSPITAIEAVSQALEEGTRLGEFRKSLEGKENPTRNDIERGGYATREVSIDFSRAGHYGRQVNQVKAFFNAAVQGADKIGRMWRNNPATMMIRAVSYITLPSMLLWLVNNDDERYQELPRWRKDLYWVFLGADKPTFIPKPPGLGVIFGTLPERILEWIETEDNSAIEDLVKVMFEQFTPINLTQPLDWLPDALTPWVEVATNTNAFFGGNIVPMREERFRPEQQYSSYTSETAKAIGRMLKASPRKVDHLMKSYGAGLADHALNFIDILAGEALDTQTPSELVPGLQAFTGSYYRGSQSIDEFYRIRDQIEKDHATYQEQIKRKQRPTAPPPNPQLRKFFSRTSEQLSELRKQKRQIQDAKDIPGEVKRKMTSAIDKQMTSVARQAIGKGPLQQAR